MRLAVSLHAPDDEARDELVPVNRRWKVAEVLDAAWDYAAATGRRVSIEYALIRDVNDQPWRADLLGRPAGGPPGAREPDPAQPDPRLQVDRLPPRRPGGVRPPGRRPRCRGRPSATPAAARSTAPAASWPRPSPAAPWAPPAAPAPRSSRWPNRLTARLPARPFRRGTMPAVMWWKSLKRRVDTARRRRALARRALGLARVPAGRRGDRGHAGGRAFARFGRGSLMAFPPGAVFGEGGIAVGDDTLIGAAGHPVGGASSPARTSVRTTLLRDRRPVRDRPRQPHRGAPVRRDRRRRLDRPLRLHHRPEPRLRGPGRPDRPPVPGQPPGQHRRGLVARRRARSSCPAPGSAATWWSRPAPWSAAMSPTGAWWRACPRRSSASTPTQAGSLPGPRPKPSPPPGRSPRRSGGGRGASRRRPGAAVRRRRGRGGA